jgi:hypothetical protein
VNENKKRSDELEQSTNWAALIELATADPPQPIQLVIALDQWAHAFERDYGGAPLLADFPSLVEGFLRRIAFADIPQEAIDWADEFEQMHGRRPRRQDLPAHIRDMIPVDAKRGGRPRSDTKRWRDIAAAWLRERYRDTYESNRDAIADAKAMGAGRALGFSALELASDRPSGLALQKLADESGLSGSRLQDVMGYRKRKKRGL